MKRKISRSQSHKGRYAVVLVAILALVIGAIVTYQMFGNRGNASPSTYSDILATSTRFSSSCRFSVLWNDDLNVSGYVFGSNNTGPFVNDTWVRFSVFENSTSAFSNVTRTLNDTIGNIVHWKFWCNDSDNRWQSIGSQYLLIDSNKVLLATSMGDITIQLYDDMPITTGNFKNLTRMGIFNETIFHRVVYDFVIQGGDPTGTGQGDPSIARIPDELPNRHNNTRGALAMAKTSEPNSATSQFFINLKDNTGLDENFAVFGRVIAGMEVVDAIGQVPTDLTEKPPLSGGRPLTDVTLISAALVKQ